jgi:hypothetical protein
VDRAVREAVVSVGQTMELELEVDVGEWRWCGETGDVGGGESVSFVAAICVSREARRRRRSGAR